MSDIVIDLPGLQKKLYERLSPSGWSNILKGFLMSSEMLQILQQLQEESEEGKKWTPRLSQVFRAFETCPYDKLKLVVCSQSPYQFLHEGLNVADGIAFSCDNTRKLQPSLLFLQKEINNTIYPGEVYDYRYDLKPWATQGVLMLNVALTTTIGKPDTHYGLWKPFIIYLMDMLNWNNGGLIWAFLGKVSQGYMRYIGDSGYKLTASHPASAAHNRADVWDSEGLFPKIEEILKKNKKEIINWH